MTIREKIDALVKAGWSYGKLAKELGVSKSTVNRWAKGECKPSYPYYEERLDELCKKEQKKNQKNFKVGDRIRICEGKDFWVLSSNLKVGDIGTIRNIDEGLLFIDFDKTPTFDTSNNSQICPIEKDYIEKVEEEKEQPKHEFKVGDRVQFKSWEEMEKEFGLDGSGDIQCYCWFSTQMKHLCGSYATISSIYESGRVKLKDFTAAGYTDWNYSTDMLKPVEDASVKESIDTQIKHLEQKLAELKAQKEKEKWQFTEDEKVILRNLPKEILFIARDKSSNALFAFEKKPKKAHSVWIEKDKGVSEISIFSHLFKCIQWSDTEPCEFRKFI